MVSGFLGQYEYKILILVFSSKSFIFIYSTLYSTYFTKRTHNVTYALANMATMAPPTLRLAEWLEDALRS